MRRVASSVERWPLAAPFRISRGVKTVAEVVVVTIEEGEAVGRGEAVSYPRYGETPGAVLAQIASVERAVAEGADRAALQALLPAGAARNALDCALWDLEARLSGRNVGVTLGTTPAPLVTTMTVSLDTPERMGVAAAALAGAPLVKVKVNAAEPVDCLRAVRAALPDAKLIVDPNESWDASLLAGLQPLLRKLGVAFVEQPLPAGADAELEGMEMLVPACADESCHTAEDLGALARRYAMVNIKLDKAGGLTEAMRLRDAARARGMGVMVGCMICTSLSIAPALHLAAGADYADLDGPLWLREDRSGGVSAENGRLLPPAPGFWGGS